MQTTSRKWIIVGAVAILVVAAGIAAWFILRSQESETMLRLHGNVDLRQAHVAFPISERIAVMHVEEGQTVSHGELLAELETERIAPTVEQAAASLEAREQRLAELERGTRPEEIQQRRSELEAAQARLANVRRKLERLQQVVGVGAVTEQDVDDAQAAEEVARAELAVARQALDLAEQGPRQEQIARARATRNAAKAHLAAAQQRLEDTDLMSPVNGVIRDRLVEPGEVTGPERPVYSIAVTDPKWVRAYLAGRDLGHVRPGMAARISSETFPDRTYEGWIGFISPSAEFTPQQVQTEDLRASLVYRVRVYVRDLDDELRLGMPVTVTVPIDRSD